MVRTMVKQLPKKIGKKIKIQGWVHSVRIQGSIVFFHIREKTGITQCVVEKHSAAFETAKELHEEFVITVIGTVQSQQEAAEVLVQSLEILSKPEKELPIPIVRKGQEETNLKKRLDYRWLDLRRPEKRLIFEIGTYVHSVMREYLVRQGFIEATTPKIMASPSESKAELFSLSYYGKKAYLAQSAQFYKQLAMAAGFEKFFTFGDTYREDPSTTVWHVAQFTTLDIELSFISGFTELMRFEEKLLVHTMKKIKERYGKEIREVFGVEIVIPTTPFPKITMAEAKRIVREQMGSTEQGDDLSSPEEKMLCSFVKKQYGHEFVFLTEFPVSVRPFYHMKSTAMTTRSADLLFKEREIFTTAQREHRYPVLCSQVKEKGLRQQELQHYLDFFRYGCPPHGGLGFGFERFLKILLGLPNIRETVLLPRDMKRLSP
ncbi:aspartate--tRNA(Asn) ligase [bacterium]|nr:aspartate--tRNA(Asn) ligase [bacterium]